MNNCLTTIIMRPSFCLRQALEEFTIWRTQLLCQLAEKEGMKKRIWVQLKNLRTRISTLSVVDWDPIPVVYYNRYKLKQD